MNIATAPNASTVPTLRLHRDIAASAEELFDAWLDAESISQWMHPSPIERTVATVDARVGGRFEFIMYLNGEPLPHTGRYIRIDRPSQLIFTWNSHATQDKDTLVTVDFEARGELTRITITHEKLKDAETLRKHEGGWSSILEEIGRKLGR